MFYENKLPSEVTHVDLWHRMGSVEGKIKAKL